MSERKICVLFPFSVFFGDGSTGKVVAPVVLVICQKKQKLSRQQYFCRKNFPDKACTSRQFLNLRQMRVEGLIARF